MLATDVDPDRPGLETVYIHEDPHPRNGFGLWDSRTGERLYLAEQLSAIDGTGGLTPEQANHMIEMARAWMRPGYLLPVHDLEAGISQRTSDELAHVVDILPTCLDVAGATYPEAYDGHRLTPLDGRSLTPVFAGESRPGHSARWRGHSASLTSAESH